MNHWDLTEATQVVFFIILLRGLLDFNKNNPTKCFYTTALC